MYLQLLMLSQVLQIQYYIFMIYLHSITIENYESNLC